VTDPAPIQPFELRPARIDELPAIGELVRRCEAHDRVPRVLDDDELAQDLAASHIDLTLDTRVAVRDGELVGWSFLWHPPVSARLDRADLFGMVAPEHRGTGIGRALLAWGVDRAADRFGERDHDLPCYTRVHAYDWQEEAAALYRRSGLEAVRWSDELVRSLADLPTVPTPAGIRLVPWPDDRDDEARHVRNEAFADHWGSTPLDEETWHDYVRGHGARADVSVIAVDEATDEMLALCLNAAYPEDEAVTGRRDAWIGNLATLRPARGRGIASALVGWSLAAFADAGFDHAMIEVDTDNPTGAARLYRNLGFEPLHRSVTYQLEVRAP
jgi:mycothiol synthase